MSTILIHPDPGPLRTLLASAGERLQVAGEFSDSPAALAAAGQLRPDVVFASMEMADVPSVDLLAQLTGLGIEVVAVSQWGTFAYEAIRCGAIGFLTEPIRAADLDELLPRLKNRLHERRILRAARALSEEIKRPSED